MTTSTETAQAPLQLLTPVADDKNLLKTTVDSDSCCGGGCCSTS